MSRSVSSSGVRPTVLNIQFKSDTTAVKAATPYTVTIDGDTTPQTLNILNGGADFYKVNEDALVDAVEIDLSGLTTTSQYALQPNIIDKLNVLDVLKKCEATILEQKLNDIKEYNNNVDLVKLALNKITTGSTSSPVSITQEEYDAWMWLSTNDPFSTINKLNISANDFSVGQSGLPLVVEYIITNYSKNGTKDLKSFNLAKLSYKDNTVYVPQKKADVSVDTTTYFVDNAGYLANNEIKVVGIMRPSEDAVNDQTSGMVGYTKELMEKLITDVNNSEIKPTYVRQDIKEILKELQE